jgi:hypothetical protein
MSLSGTLPRPCLFPQGGRAIAWTAMLPSSKGAPVVGLPGRPPHPCLRRRRGLEDLPCDVHPVTQVDPPSRPLAGPRRSRWLHSPPLRAGSTGPSASDLAAIPTLRSPDGPRLAGLTSSPGLFLRSIVPCGRVHSCPFRFPGPDIGEGDAAPPLVPLLPFLPASAAFSSHRSAGLLHPAADLAVHLVAGEGHAPSCALRSRGESTR